MPADLLYRRQFVMGRSGLDRRSSWRQLTIGQSFRLAAHPDLPLHQVRRGELTLTLLGHVLDPGQPEADDRQILEGWLRRLTTLRDVFTLSARYGGRWAMIAGDDRHLWLFHDLAGLRTVVYTSDPAHDLWCASDARIIADEVGLTPDEQFRRTLIAPFTYRDAWLPADATPYRECRALLPNHYLDLGTRAIHRYWPDRPRDDYRLEEGVTRASALLEGLMAAASRRFPLALGITAGQDSRLLLAAARGLRDALYCYTIDRRGGTDDTSMDVGIPARMLPVLGLRHHVLRCPPAAGDDVRSVIRESLALASDFRAPEVQALADHIPSPRVRVSGHVGELGRCFYGRDRDRPPTAADLADCARRSGSRLARRLYQDWLDEVTPLATGCGYDVWDLFHQESRLARWAAAIQAQYDIAIETFTPFNCRRLVETFLAVDKHYRRGKPLCAMYAAMIRRLWPELLDWPFNPEPRWRRLSNRALRAVGLFGPAQRFMTRA